MKISDLSTSKRQGVYAHLEGIGVIAGAMTVALVMSNGTDEERDELVEMLRQRHGEEVYDPRRHRLVAIMADERKPGDAAQAVEDVVGGNADAARVFDAIGEAFGIRSDGGHVNLDVHIDNDRVSIESWAPPVRKETPLLQPWDGSPVKPGETIAATAVDIKPRPLAKFGLDDLVFIKYGDDLAGPAKITGVTHYADAETQYLACYITKKGDPQTVWSGEGALRSPSEVAMKGEEGPAVATDHHRV